MWHFVTFVEIRTFTKFIKPTQYSCSCNICKLLSLFEASVGTGLTSIRSHVERNKSWLILVHVGSEGLYTVTDFDVSTLRTTNWSCLPLPPSPCVPRSAHASPSPVRYQNGACFKKYNYHLFSLRVSDKAASLRSWVYTFMYSCDSSCQLKPRVFSQFTSSLFPLHLRHLSNCSYQMHLQIEKLIITVPFRMYSLHDLF